MALLARLVTLGIPFADAPNPADCPHRQCADYHPSAAGIAVLAIVAIVVAVLILAIVMSLLFRRRRRRRRRRAG